MKLNKVSPTSKQCASVTWIIWMFLYVFNTHIELVAINVVVKIWFRILKLDFWFQLSVTVACAYDCDGMNSERYYTNKLIRSLFRSYPQRQHHNVRLTCVPCLFKQCEWKRDTHTQTNIEMQCRIRSRRKTKSVRLCDIVYCSVAHAIAIIRTYYCKWKLKWKILLQYSKPYFHHYICIRTSVFIIREKRFCVYRYS